jgi:hypothetical protein
VNNESLLAERIARVSLGQYNHVAKILAGTEVAPLSVGEHQVTGAIKLLTVPDGGDPWHRDGWLFQVISWIASHRVKPGLVIRAPQMIWAHKGFDGLQLEVEETSGAITAVIIAITAVIIFEDKATENPRSTIKESVWADFEKLEDDDRINVLVADATGLLAQYLRHYPNIDVDEAVQNIVWKKARHYRASVTINEMHNTLAGHRRLFKGYDSVVVGEVCRRRAETILIPELRPWMAQLAKQSIATIYEMVSENV